jgi:hypothetical protein
LCQSSTPVYGVPRSAWSLENSQSFYSHICSFTIEEILPFKTMMTLTDQHPTAIMVLNGKISSMVKEQIWL